MNIQYGLFPAFLSLLFAVSLSGESLTKAASESKQPVEKKVNFPRMVDFGADKCVPCKTMAPILKDLQNEYKNQVEVVFIDVWKDRAAGQKAGIKLIPTQVFYDTAGKEVFRHEGFMSKEDILKVWHKYKFLPVEKE